MFSVEELLSNAKKQIVLIGAVPLQIDWRKLTTVVSEKLKAPNFNMKVICESENWLFMKSLTTDLPNSEPRISYSDLYEIRASIFELPNYLKDNGASEDNIKKLNIVVSHLDLSMPILMVDGDIILAIDGENMFTDRQLMNKIKKKTPGDVITVSILRGDQTIDIQVELEIEP